MSLESAKGPEFPTTVANAKRLAQSLESLTVGDFPILRRELEEELTPKQIEALRDLVQFVLPQKDQKPTKEARRTER